ncbi:MAG: amino acid adenylation domain-containing protein [Cyanobacteria bacterium P01_F01_bin.143]
MKIRGFRIELGEIEAALTNYPEIQSAIAVVRDERLIAYFISRKNVTCDVITLRSFLSNKLPSYMIPGTFIPLESFPLTPNGKIDRKALPLPETIEIAEDKDTLITPQTTTEEILLGIWTEILNQNQIGINSNFFALGGHSLLVTKVISQVRQAFTIDLPLRTLFEAPTIRDLAQAVDRVQSNSDNKLEDIEIISRDGELQLSFAQQRQWFLHQLEPDNSAYNISTAVKITGQLDIQKLQQCLNILVEHQEILQTAFLTVEGKPQLIVNPDAAINLELRDLTRLSNKEKQQEIQQLIEEDTQKPFALDQSPLMRVKLLQIDSVEQILLLSLHHIIADAWSMGVLVKEIVGIYLKAVGAQGLRPKQEIQYLDYATWQRKWLQGDLLERQLSYWQQQLHNPPIISSFPADKARKLEPAIAEISRFKINRDTTNSLKQISNNAKSTLFMTVLAALFLLLHRYTGNDDLVIGTSIANRNRPELENLIGFFANTLALRADLSNNPSFTELLTQVRETTLAAYTHQDLPFEQLVDSLEIERSLSHMPLFQIFLVWEAQSREKLAIEDLTWEVLPRETATVAKFDLTFFLTETPEGINGAIEFNTALYNPETIDRLTKHFQNLLTSIASNATQPISELAFLDQEEKKQLLEEFNQTPVDFPQNICLHQLFENQVQLTPDAIALVYEQQQLTYAELNNRADELASYLQSLGVQAETKVGVMCDRNLEMIVALLAILKAGGCYIPLDPKYPQQRLDWILEDTQLSILLTQTKYAEKLNTDNLILINLDSSLPFDTGVGRKPCPKGLASRRAPTTPSASSASSAPNLAYIIYTSGSTGKPKGVAIAHKNAVTLCHWAQNTFSQSQLAGVLASTSICFDLSVFEIFVTLTSGGAVILAENALELPSLNSLVPITLINTVPSAARELLRIKGIPETVNTVNLAGEALPKDLVDKLYQKEHINQVYNLYGPSEDTTYSTFTLTKANDDKSPNIGNAIANKQTYILDKYLQPVPRGIVGELYLAGEGVARGYFNRPELTAEKFIPNPFSLNIDHLPLTSQSSAPSASSATSAPSASLLYKTGDLARYLPNGEIEYLGRIDNQIKLRGFRIELGEIETVLANHPDVETAIVINREQRLIAYVIPVAGEGEQPFAPTELKSYLQTQLPDYMIPGAFVALDTFPLTPNGKIDRKSLPDPEFTREALDSEITTASTETEVKLVGIWQELLGITEIGIKDNFFALGGDSILAIQAIAKASQVGIQLTPKNLFQYQTIAELARVASVKNHIEAEQGIVTGIVPLTPVQHWFFEQNLLDAHHWNQSVWLEVRQPLKSDLLEQAIAKVLAHHDALRLSFQLTDSQWQQTNQGIDIASSLVQVDLTNYAQDEQEAEKLKIINQLQSSFDLATAPLIKIAWFKLGNNQADRLLIIAHHLVIDGVSWRILLEDLQIVYQLLEQSKEILLPPKTTSWKQWSEELQKVDVTSELDYWLQQKNQCDGEQLFEQTTVAESKAIAITLDSQKTQQLLREVPEAYQTQINDILLTALSQTWQELYNRDRLLIELEGHGREDIIDNLDISRTVGWFTSIYPLVLSLDANNIEQNIKSIKEQIRSIPNRGIGYGLLRYLNQEEALIDFPQAAIRFNYLGQTDRLFPEDSLFYPVSESAREMRSLRDRRNCAIEIDSIIIDEQLKLKWVYSEANFSDAEMENVTQTYLVKLQKLIQHCLSKDAGGYTPSDFAQMNFSQDELDDILDDL